MRGKLLDVDVSDPAESPKLRVDAIPGEGTCPGGVGERPPGGVERCEVVGRCTRPAAAVEPGDHEECDVVGRGAAGESRSLMRAGHARSGVAAPIVADMGDQER